MPRLLCNDYKLFYSEWMPQSKTPSDEDASRSFPISDSTMPVLLLHGALGVGLNWPEPLRKSHRYRTLTVDLPGHGRAKLESDQPAINAVADYARAIIEMLDQAEVQKAHLVGHSMGGMIGQYLAVHHPERLHSMVLICSSAHPQFDARLVADLLKPDKKDQALDLMNDLNYSEATSTEMRKRAREILGTVPWPVVVGDFEACQSFDVRDALERISIPTFVIAGASDRLISPSDSQFIADSIPQATLTSIEAGHMVVVEKPQELSDMVHSFLDKH
ncbi:MAG: alpha/beta fold hydrolase [Leptospiraceae bacterium]|nr:alpha/beta fold hydrolase [Leptospiraceae bacterium]